MAKTEKRAIGDIGEEIACKFLENNGFSIIERNYLRPWGELDIVATKEGKVHFVEVKTVTREAGRRGGYRAEENMHIHKVQRLHRAIQTYLLGNNKLKDLDFQLDLACVYLKVETKQAQVEMVENIVL